MDIVWRNADDLIPYANNTKEHPRSQVENVALSIKRYGWQQPICISKDDVVIIGHCRLLAAKSLGLQRVPTICAEGLSDDEIRELRILDNKLNESPWDMKALEEELKELDFSDFNIDFNTEDFDAPQDDAEGLIPPNDVEDLRDPSMQHNVFENQDTMQFPCVGFYGIPVMQPTQVTGDKMLRFMDFNDIWNHQDYIAHFYYDDYKFISAWREPDKYLDKLRRFKAVVSPDFSLYTDFPRALQILSCYRRQWCGAYWQHKGIDVIPDVVWGDKESFAYCFDGIPKHSTVAVSTVGVARDKTWNAKEDSLFKAGYDEMLARLEPTTIMFYGDMLDGLEGNIIQVPYYYEQKMRGFK